MSLKNFKTSPKNSNGLKCKIKKRVIISMNLKTKHAPLCVLIYRKGSSDANSASGEDFGDTFQGRGKQF